VTYGLIKENQDEEKYYAEVQFKESARPRIQEKDVYAGRKVGFKEKAPKRQEASHPVIIRFLDEEVPSLPLRKDNQHV